ncbi:MAG: aldo/keto reductase [Leptospiraceae bacterium]|nr:aldo/keto reductase [Leptospiraceae bacterium]
MKYVPLGNSGLYVSRICLGTMNFGNGPMSPVIGGLDEKEVQKFVDAAFDAGVNFFDTANLYANGEAEIFLGKALSKRREEAVIATKLYNPFKSDMNSLGTSRKSILREVEGSLKRLGTDYIDLYQVHSWDPTTPLEETLTALDDLVRSGKVRYIGLSNFTGWQIARAHGISEARGLHRFISAQSYYSLVGRELEFEILPAIREYQMGLMVWSPLASGFLSGKYTGENGDSGRRAVFSFPPVDTKRGDKIVETLREIATEHRATAAQIALAWLLRQPGVSSVIVGARRLEQFNDNVQSVDVQLTDDQLLKLNEVSQPAIPFPYVDFSLRRGETLESRMAQLKS